MEMEILRPDTFYDIRINFKQNAIELFLMHRTATGDRRQALQKEAQELARNDRSLQKVVSAHAARLGARAVRRGGESHGKGPGLQSSRSRVMY